MYIPPDIVEALMQKDCEELAGVLGIEVNRHKAYCFLHQETVPSLSFHPSRKNVWHCFSCGKGGNAISLIMLHEDCGFTEACVKLCAIYGIPLSGKTGRFIPKRRHQYYASRSTNQIEATRSFDVELAEWLLCNMSLTETANRFLFEERKFCPDVISRLGIKALDESWTLSERARMTFAEDRCKKSGLFGEKGFLSFWTPCLVFPFRNKENKLIGLQSRYLGAKKDIARFQFLSGQRTHLFNMQSLPYFEKNSTVYVTEGVTDCLAMLSEGKAAVAIPSATLIPEEDLTLLEGFRLRMMPDNDDAGWSGFTKLRMALAKKGIRILSEDIPSEYKDYAEWHVANCTY